MKGTGCVYTSNGTVGTLDTFQALTGTGYRWQQQMNAKAVPNSYQVGTDSNGKMYLGRCNIGNSQAVIGRVTNNFYFEVNNTETDQRVMTGCQHHEVLACI